MKQGKNTRLSSGGGFLARWLLYLLGSAVAASPLAASAQTNIVRDGSLGAGPTSALTAAGTVTSSGVTYNQYAIPESYGQRAGNNVFHSFSNFSIGSGDGAVFTINSAASNVISRVTGGQASTINGLMSLDPGSTGSKPNFFFINPAGVTFGAGAVVDVPAAFHVGTADYLKFPDGNFYADTAQASTLSTAAPEAFGFLGNTRATIVIRDGAVLTTQPSQAINVVGGDIEIDGGLIYSQGGGDIRMLANGTAAQEISLSGALPAAGGDFTITRGGLIGSGSESGAGGSISVSAGALTIDPQDSGAQTGIATYSSTCDCYSAGNITVATTGLLSMANGGSITSETASSGSSGAIKINAGNITLASGSRIYTGTTSSGDAGAIDIAAGQDVTLTEGAVIASGTYAAGKAGAISVNAANLSIDGSAYAGFTGIASNAFPDSSGSSGDISIKVTSNLSLIDGGAIDTDIEGSGAAGNVTVWAENIFIDGMGSGAFTGMTSDAMRGSSGNAGSLTVTAGSLTLQNGAYVTSDTYGSGSAGQVKVSASSITVDGKDSGLFTGISSDATSSSTGHAGNVTVAASELTLLDGGSVSSDTYSSGNAGSVNVSATTLKIRGIDARISSKAVEDSSGNAGDVTVTAETLSIIDDGTINSDTYGSGTAGKVTVSADSIAIDGTNGYIFTGISSDSLRDISGNAGGVTITAKSLSIINSGAITSDAYGPGAAGTVVITADTLSIDAQGSGYFTGISSDSLRDSTGNAGDVTVKAGTLSLLNGGTISSDAYGQGAAGKVSVQAASLTIDGQGGSSYTGISSEAIEGSSGNAGDVTVSADTLSVLNGGRISSNTAGQGAAGKVAVYATSLSIDSQGSGAFTGISSDALSGSAGNAGDVTVNAGTLSVIDGGTISSDTYAQGSAGKVSVYATNLTVDSKGGSTFTGISSEAIAGSSGHAGDVSVSADSFSVLNGGRVSSNTAGPGNAGKVVIAANTLTIDAQGSGAFTGVSSDALGDSTGNAGDVTVNAGSLSIAGGSTISSDTYSQGAAGKVSVSATTLTIDGQGGSALTGISSKAAEGSSGNAGDVVVSAGSLSLLNGGKINSDTYGLGAAGTISIAATTLDIDGKGIDTGISSQAMQGSSGNAGDVAISVSGNLSIVNGGEITSSTGASGNAGSVTVNTGNLLVDSQGGTLGTGISSAALQDSAGTAGIVTVAAAGSISLTGEGSHITTSTRSTSSLGNAGSIEVAASQIRLTSNAQISSDTYGPGAAGNVTVTANGGSILVDSGASIRASATGGSSGQTGNLLVTASSDITLSNGGKLAIQNDATVDDPSVLVPTLLQVSAPSITLIDAQITAASTGNVAASNIKVTTTERLYLDPSSISTSSNLGNGGSISIDGGKLVWLDNSQITTSVTGLTGNGGDISITADTLLMTTGFIQANTAARDASGGYVSINVNSLLTSGNSLFVGGSTPYQFTPFLFGFNVIQAAAPTGVSGVVAISTPALDISGSLTQLNTQMFDLGALSRDLCDIGVGSSLTPVGRGGLPPLARDFIRPEFE